MRLLGLLFFRQKPPASPMDMFPLVALGKPSAFKLAHKPLSPQKNRHII